MRQIELIRLHSLANKESSYIPVGYRSAYCFSVTSQPKNQPLFSRSKTSSIDNGLGQTFQTFQSRKETYAYAIKLALSTPPNDAWIQLHFYLEPTPASSQLQLIPIRSLRLPSPSDPLRSYKYHPIPHYPNLSQ